MGNVDLSEVAAFMREVRAPRTFEIVAGFSKVSKTTRAGVKINVSTKHWKRVNQKNWQEEPLTEMSHVLKKIERRTDSFEKLLDAPEPSRKSMTRGPSRSLSHTGKNMDA